MGGRINRICPSRILNLFSITLMVQSGAHQSCGQCQRRELRLNVWKGSRKHFQITGLNILWLRSSLVVIERLAVKVTVASLGFGPTILWHSGIWGAANEAMLKNIHKKKNPKNPKNCLPLKRHTSRDAFPLIPLYTVHTAQAEKENSLTNMVRSVHRFSSISYYSISFLGS